MTAVQALPHGRVVMTGDEAAAYGAMLARVQAIGCYPITPQTIIVERLADLSIGRDDVAFVNLESEHSMFGWAIAAARAGVRAFTATSSQGLLYAHEQLHRASRERVPLVAVNVNRGVLAPWSLETDLSDSMSQRDTGWIQLYCASVQEVLDTVVCAYRIAETVMLPVLVCAEGFLLSHTSELLDVPRQETVDAFLPALHLPEGFVLDPAKARSFSAMPTPSDYFAFQRAVADAMDHAQGVIGAVAEEFGSAFGRTKIGALDLTGNPEAETALVTIGTIGDTAKEVASDDILNVRVHQYRPFPAAELRAALAHAKHIAVIDRAAAFGSLGPLATDVLSLDLARATSATSFVCGLGGSEVTPATLRWAIEETRATLGRSGPVYVPEGVER